MSTNFTDDTYVTCCAMYLYQSSRFEIRNVFISVRFDVCFGKNEVYIFVLFFKLKLHFIRGQNIYALFKY